MDRFVLCCLLQLAAVGLMASPASAYLGLQQAYDLWDSVRTPISTGLACSAAWPAIYAIAVIYNVLVHCMSFDLQVVFKHVQLGTMEGIPLHVVDYEGIR